MRIRPSLLIGAILIAAIAGGGAFILTQKNSWRPVAALVTPRSPAADALLNRAKDSYAAAQKLRGSARLEQLAQATQFFQDAAQKDSSIAASPQNLKALQEYARELMAALRSSAGMADHLRSFEAQAHALNAQLRAAKWSAEWALDLAEFERSQGAIDKARLPLSVGYARARALPEKDGDPIVVEAIRQLTAMAASDRYMAFYWAEDIRRPALRVQALSLIARMRLAKGDYTDPALSSFINQSPAAIAARGDLSNLAQIYRVKADSEIAAILGLAMDQKAPERDDSLQSVATQLVAANKRDGAQLAALGIMDVERRNDALAVLATAYSADPQVSEALRLIGFISDPGLRAMGLAEAAERLAKLGLDAQAAAVQESAERDFAKARLSADERDRYFHALARVAIGASRWPDAARLITKISDPTFRAETRLLAADLAVRGKRYDEAIDMVRWLPEAAKTRGDAIKATALALNGQIDSAANTAKSIKDPAARQLALAACVKASASSGAISDAHAVLDEMKRTPIPADANAFMDSKAAMAMALAAMGQPEEAVKLAPLFLSQRPSSGDALLDIVSGWVRKGNLKEAERVAGWAQDEKRANLIAPHIAQELGDIGAYRAAAEYTLKIADTRTRVTTQRAIATSSARALDAERLLGRREPRSVNAAAASPSPFLRTFGYDYYQMATDKPTDSVGGLPRFASIRSTEVSRQIPAPLDGTIEVVPMFYNAYGQKFLYNTVSSLYANIDRDFFSQQAQSTRYPLYIHIGSGVYTIPSLYRQLQESGRPDVLVKQGSTYLLRLPVLVAPGATLIVSGADTAELRMEQERGVMIVNAGNLYFHGTKVTGWETTGNAPSELTYETRRKFRPFIISWGGSHMSAASTEFSHLGFSGATKAYGFSYSQGPLQVLRERPGSLEAPTGDLIENSFDNLYFGFFTFESGRIRVVGNEFRDNIVYGLDPHDYSKNLEIAFNTSYGAHKKHGIIASRNVTNSYFVGNLSFGNHGSGIMMDRASSQNLIYANRVWNNAGDGISIFESSCNLLAANSVQGNLRDAIKVRNSTDVGVFSNSLLDNVGSAVRVYVGTPTAADGAPQRDLGLDPYSQYSSVAVIDNDIRENGPTALTSAGFGAIALRGNRIATGEKVYGGDLHPISGALWRMQGQGVVVRSSCTPPKLQQRCSLFSGSLIASAATPVPAQGAGATCAGVVDFDDESVETAESDSQSEEGADE